MADTRCGLCGKPMAVGDAIVQITRAVLKKAGAERKASWGDCHESCFNNAMPTPKAAMNELSRMSKQAVKSAPKGLTVRTPPDLFPGARSKAKKAVAKKKKAGSKAA